MPVEGKNALTLLISALVAGRVRRQSTKYIGLILRAEGKHV